LHLIIWEIFKELNKKTLVALMIHGTSLAEGPCPKLIEVKPLVRDLNALKCRSSEVRTSPTKKYLRGKELHVSGTRTGKEKGQKKVEAE